MPGYQDPFMGGPPQMGPQGQQGPPPRQGPPQQGPGMGGGAPEFDQNHPAYLRFMSGPGGQQMQRGQARDKYQGAIDDLMMQLQFAQMQGQNPMQIADLQMQLQQAQRGMGEWQNEAYANQMAKYTQAGPGPVGSNRPGMSQLQKNPFLEMLLMGQLGMGGGPAGGRGGQQIG